MTTFDVSLQDLQERWPGKLDQFERVGERFPFRSSRFYAGLIRSPGDPLWRQVIPETAELEDETGWEDPLNEENLSPVPNLVHRYPNRVLWLVASECALHCRFCTRKRRWRKPLAMTEAYVDGALTYMATHPELKDVILSGGDPLLLPVVRLESILSNLRKIRHLEVIRIGTRVPCALPDRVTEALAGMMSRYHPVYVNIHFNHPWELTPEARRACAVLAEAGIPLASQTVLLRGVNDRAEVLGELFQGLLSLRVRPYYLMQMDLIQGAAHFRTPVSTGLEILATLRNRISGMAIPHLVIDLPGGRGKVPLLPNTTEGITDGKLMVRDYLGGLSAYPLLPGEEVELARWLRK